MCLDVAEYGVRSAVETTSAMVKLAFTLSLVCETREVEVLESHEQGADTSRAHSWVIEVCERNVSAKYQREGEVTSVKEGRDVQRTTETVRVST